MAIFGSLRDMPFPDLVGMLGKRSGVLEIFNLPSHRQGYSIALEGGKVLWVREGRRTLDPLQARSVLQELFRMQHGSFEFVATIPPPPPDGQVLGWPLERLLLTMTAIDDEASAYRSSLPDPQTRFEVASMDTWLEEPLWSFWERVAPLLARPGGVSSEEIARRLGLREREVAYYLYKLRLSGKIRPVRAYEEAARTEGKSAQDIFRRLLASLLGRGR